MQALLPDQTRVFPDRDTLHAQAAERVIRLCADAIAARGRCNLALAGGNTPRGLYRRLAEPDQRARIDWRRMHLFFGDERAVPLDHPDSNYRMAREVLIDHVPVPPAQVHPMRAAPETIEADAGAYAELLARELPDREGWPGFDLILLGLGPDGHTASLFPDTPALHELGRSVTPVHVERLDSWRLTLTLPVIDRAERLLFLVAGADKAAIVAALRAGTQGRDPYPVEYLSPRGQVEWLLDAEASGGPA